MCLSYLQLYSFARFFSERELMTNILNKSGGKNMQTQDTIE